MQPTRIVAIRHGETDWNAGARLQGQIDIALNRLGRAQAARLAGALGDEGLEAVISSDLSRAADTARAFAEPLGLPLTLDKGLRERAFGLFEGRTYDEIAQHWPEMAQRWRSRDPHFAADGGETLAGFQERCVAAAERIALAHAGRSIALVAHGGVLDALYRAAVRIPIDAPRTWQLGNASVNRLLHTPQGFAVVGWDDRRHLDDLHAGPD